MISKPHAWFPLLCTVSDDDDCNDDDGDDGDDDDNDGDKEHISFRSRA